MMIEHAARMLRRALGVTSAEKHIAPRALAAALGVNLLGMAGERLALSGSELRYDDTAPNQDYQIARGACAYALRQMGLLAELSPHDLAVMLCGVGSAPPGAQRAEVVDMSHARVRRFELSTSRG